MQKQSELPKGWAECQIKDISDVIGGGTPKTSEPNFFSENGISWITPADLGGYNEIYISKGNRSLSEEGLKSCSAKLMPTGTVLMSSRAPIGYIAIAANPMSTNQGFKSFVCHDGIFPEYVYFWLKFKKPLIESMGSGSTFKEVSGSRAKTIPIHIPPIIEQHRIVSATEALFARLDAANEQLDRVPEILQKYRQSVLAAACDGKLTEDWRKGYEESDSLENLLNEILDERNKRFQKKVEKAQINGKNNPKPPNNLKRQKLIYDDLVELPFNWIWVTWDDLVDWITYGFTRPMPHVENGIPIITAKNINNSKIYVTIQPFSNFTQLI